MRVSVWYGGRGTYGIRVGYPNRDKFFCRDWEEIEVEMGAKSHSFALTKGFWHRCPEFRDRGNPIIRNWLRMQGPLEWPKGAPPCFELTPLGSNRFHLVP
jgi:hypothetical protein